MVSAQATRTWVAGDGDDGNPCNRTSPCKSFAGAVAKTAAGGEINCLNPGGFGAVTITRTLTISCPYTEGGLFAGASGITINAGPNDVVYLRGLDIYGIGASGNGVSFVAGAALHIEDSVIRGFGSGFGVAFQPTGSSQLFITDTTVANNGSAATGNGGGVLVRPTGMGVAGVDIRNARLQGNANYGINLDATQNPSGSTAISANVEGSQVSASGTGISVLTVPNAALARLMVNRSTLTLNGTGLSANGAGAIARVGNTTITNNSTGVASQNGAILNSYLDNQMNGNDADGRFTDPISPGL